MNPRLRVHNISKQFGLLQALKPVSFDLFPAEVVGVAGRSGAGKTVLTMVLAGQYAPTSGTIILENKQVQWAASAPRPKMDVIYQEPSLVDGLDITSNIFLGKEMGSPSFSRWFKIPSREDMDEVARHILLQLGLNVDSLSEQVANLTAEQRQLVAIARVMVSPAPLIIIDEPTSLLGYTNQQKLLSLIEAWQQQGASILFCSNNLDHLFAVTDRMTVLRQGVMVGQHRTDETTREEIVAELLGTTDRQQLTPALWALDSFYRARQQAERLRHQQNQLRENLAAQGSLNKGLIIQLDQQVQALDQANLALQDANRRLLTEREEERKHLARELHDQIIQDLLGINYQLEGVTTNTLPSAILLNEVTDVRERIQLLIDDLRRICGDLRPLTIDSLGLSAALQSLTRDWSARTQITVELDIATQIGRLPEAIELSIFRIVQESLNNVWKHADASQVKISMSNLSSRMLYLSIIDNGCGLPEGVDLSVMSRQGHYGLLGISERVALMQGRLRLRNQVNGGLHIEVEIPHPRADKSKPYLP